MPDKQINNAVFKDVIEILKSKETKSSIEEIENMILSMKFARASLKEREQKRIQNDEITCIEHFVQQNNLQEKILYVPKNAISITREAFRDNKEITKVVLNEGLAEIGEYAFADCTNLREVVFPSNKILLRRGCFLNCKSLTSVEIPRISTIGPDSFRNCISLKKVSVPSNISNIYSRAFSNCRSLKEVKFKKTFFRGWGTVYTEAFADCVSLETFKFPSGLGAQNNKIFINCSNLKEIYIYNGRIKKFANCDATVFNI